MRNFLLFFSGIFLLGCQTLPENTPPELPNLQSHHILLQDSLGNFNGIALGFEKDLFLSVRANDEKNPEIFWGGTPIEIEKQFLEKNIIFFRLQTKTPLFEAIENTPLIGTDVYWFSNAEIRTGKISGISETEVFIDGKIDPYIQGSPIFTADQKLIGLLSQADPKKNILIGTKIHPILEFWETNR